MFRQLLTLGLGSLAFAGCTAVDDGESTTGPRTDVSAAASEAAADFEAAGPDSAAETLPADAGQMALLEDPDFVEYLQQEMLPETGVEPSVNPEEFKVLTKAIALMGEDPPRYEDALSRILDARRDGETAALPFYLGNIRFQQAADPGLTDDGERQRLLLESYGYYKEARLSFNKYLRAWQGEGAAAFELKRWIEAKAALTKVIQLGEGDDKTWGLLGAAHSQLGDYINAEFAFRKAATMAPNNTDWKFGLADTFQRQERYLESIALFNVLIQLQPARADLYLAQGDAYARVGKPLRAIQNLEFVHSLGGSTSGSLLTLGNNYANEKLYDQSVDAYMRALSLGEKTQLAPIVEATNFMIFNEATDAARNLADGIEKVRGESLTKEQRIELSRVRSRIAIVEGDAAAAAVQLENIVREDPLDGDALVRLGEHYRGERDFANAKNRLERAAELPDFEGRAKSLLGQILVDQGKDYAKALKLLRRAQELQPSDALQAYIEYVERLSKKNAG